MKKDKVKISFNFNDFKLIVKDDKVIDFTISKVKAFTSGAYIPISKKYINKEVIILVLETKQEV